MNSKALTKLLNILVVAILATMSCLVFLNVVLRYGFNTSINISEELSRFLFVWLTFLGAIICFADNSHVSVKVFTEKLPPAIQRILSVISDGLMLFCAVLLSIGSYQQTVLNLHNYAPISNLPTAITYAAALVTGIAFSLILTLRLTIKCLECFKGENKWRS